MTHKFVKMNWKYGSDHESLVLLKSASKVRCAKRQVCVIILDLVYSVSFWGNMAVN